MKFRRHPYEVTADRLIEHACDPRIILTGRERDAIGEIIHALRENAEGER